MELPHDKIAALLFMRNEPAADATELRKRVQALVEEGTASMLDTQLITSYSSVRVRTESHVQMYYPDHFSWPTLPKDIRIPNKDDGSTLVPGRVGWSPLPDQFARNEWGSILEVEPNLSKRGSRIDLRVTSSLTWHTGNTLWWERPNDMGGIDKVEMPETYKILMDTHFSLKDGTYLLAAVVTPKDGKGRPDLTRKVMIFVKANALVVEAIWTPCLPKE